MNDLKFAFRQLLKNPGFTAVVVLTLALGLGGTAAVHSVLNKLVLDPFGTNPPGRLVLIGEQKSEQTNLQQVDPVVLEALTHDLERLAEFAWYQMVTFNQSTETFSEQVNGAAVSSSFFQVLGVRAHLGRTFAPGEASERTADGSLLGNTGIILSYGFWRSSFSSDPSILGRELRLSGSNYTVIGVMSEEFGFPWGGTRFWVPASLLPSGAGLSATGRVNVIARVGPAIDEQEFRAAVESISQRIVKQAREEGGAFGENASLLHEATWSLQVRPLRDHFANESMRSNLGGLLGAFGFIMLIVCCNLAGLTLLRIEGRRRELAVRAALGAGRCRSRLQFFEFLLGQSGLLENRSKCSRGNVGRVHRHVRLPAIGMSQYDMGARLSPNDKSSPLQPSEDFTRFVRHRQEVPQSRKRTRSVPEWPRDGLVFRRPTAARDHERPREPLQVPTRASSGPRLECVRNNTPRGSRLPGCARTECRSSLPTRIVTWRPGIKSAAAPAWIVILHLRLMSHHLQRITHL